MGGFGIRSITTMKKALHGKWLRRFLSVEDSLWKKIIQIKWMQRGNDSSIHISSRPYGTNAWKSIMRMFDVLNGNTR